MDIHLFIVARTVLCPPSTAATSTCPLNGICTIWPKVPLSCSIIRVPIMARWRN